MAGRTLAAILDDRDNSFNAVRLLAAAAVFVSHAFLIVPAGHHGEPLDGTAYNLGQISVNVFFFLSGLMLSRSFALKPDLVSFAIARLLRILPGLAICGVVTALLLGVFATRLDPLAYYSNGETWLYPLMVLIKFNGATLPEAFGFGMEPGAVNTPLWTVKFELMAYAAFMIIPLLGLFGSRRTAWLLTLGFALLLVVSYATRAFDTNVLGSIIRFGFCFSLGMLAFQYREQIVASWIFAALGLIAALVLTWLPVGQVFSIIAFAYLAINIGGTRIPVLTARTNRADISYGFYLYAFPVQQLLMARYGHNVEMAILTGVVALVIGAGFAWLSWTLVEKPALSLKKSLPALAGHWLHPRAESTH